MKPVVFIIPPHLQQRGRLIPSHHPIVTATLAAVSKRAGVRTFVIDMGVTNRTPEQVLADLERLQPEWVGVVPFEYRREMPIEPSLQMIQMWRRSLPEVRFGLLNCPLHSDECASAVQTEILDFVVYGDSEDCIHLWSTTNTWSGAGLVCRGDDGSLERTPPIQQVDWSIVPPPAWELFDLSRYVPSAHRYRTAPVLPIFASRSCPFGCDFCPHMLYHSSDTHSMRPIEDIIAEIVHLQQHFGVRSVEFYDPTFGVRRSHVENLCDAMMALDNPIEWTCFSRTDLWDGTLLERMSQAGCRSILFGVESGNEEVLARTQKGISLPQVELFVSECRRVGIDTVASFIIGLPLESTERIQQTIDFAQRLNPTYAQFHQARAFFDHEDWMALGTVSGSWQETSASLNGLAYVPNGFTQADIEQNLLKAYAGFYTRPSKIIELTSSIQRRADVHRLWSGVRQIATHFWALS